MSTESPLALSQSVPKLATSQHSLADDPKSKCTPPFAKQQFQLTMELFPFVLHVIAVYMRRNNRFFEDHIFNIITQWIRLN